MSAADATGVVYCIIVVYQVPGICYLYALLPRGATVKYSPKRKLSPAACVLPSCIWQAKNPEDSWKILEHSQKNTMIAVPPIHSHGQISYHASSYTYEVYHAGVY